jgi:ribulose-phosphate 3-epimerase
MKLQLAPSVLSFDLTSLATSVPQLVQGGADIIHLDVMDGNWVPPITFGDAFARSVRRHTDCFLEAHLMVAEPESQFEAFAAAGCNRILFHIEGTNHPHRLVERLRRLEVGAGIVINPGTPVSAISELVPIVDLVLVMTVDPGWGGQPLIRSALEKVRVLRRENPTLDIEVDGGIDANTVGDAKRAGANVFVVGSYLAKQNDYERAAREFKSQMEAA